MTDAIPTAPPRTGLGIVIAAAAALTFGLSGSLARGLIDVGWSPDAAVMARIWIAALVLLVPTLYALRGRWRAVGRNLGLIGAFGLFAVLGTQFCYFHAVERMDVGIALLIQFIAPIVIVLWLWLRRGERPTARSIIGAIIAFLGLVLMLDILTGARIDGIGILWALGGMTGTVIYFLLSARRDTGIPPIAFAGLGMAVGAIVLTLVRLLGLLPTTWSTDAVAFRFGEVPWFVPVIVLGVVSAALAFVLSVTATRILGSRLASFIAISEVVAALLFAWLLLGQLPDLLQLFGGLLVLVGVVVVKLGEPVPAARTVPSDTGEIPKPSQAMYT